MKKFLIILASILVLTFIFTQCERSLKNSQGAEVVSTDSTFVPVPHNGGAEVADCGINPYFLADGMFEEKDQWYKVNLRYVIFQEEREPDRVSMEVITASVNRLNKDFQELNLTFSASEIVLIEDNKAYKEGIYGHREHMSRYSERRYINVFLYPSTIGGYSGVAYGIPSTSVALKTHYAPSSTISHEIGHALGLYHVFQADSAALTKKHTYLSGDLVCETPAASWFAKPNNGFLGRVDDNCQLLHNPEKSGLTEEDAMGLATNIMTYSLSDCRKTFYEGQIERSRFIINNSQDLRETMELTSPPKYAK